MHRPQTTRSTTSPQSRPSPSLKRLSSAVRWRTVQAHVTTHPATVIAALKASGLMSKLPQPDPNAPKIIETPDLDGIIKYIRDNDCKRAQPLPAALSSRDRSEHHRHGWCRYLHSSRHPRLPLQGHWTLRQPAGVLLTYRTACAAHPHRRTTCRTPRPCLSSATLSSTPSPSSSWPRRCIRVRGACVPSQPASRRADNFKPTLSVTKIWVL